METLELTEEFSLFQLYCPLEISNKISKKSYRYKHLENGRKYNQRRAIPQKILNLYWLQINSPYILVADIQWEGKEKHMEMWSKIRMCCL